ncbi:MAG: signal peptidase II [Clostridiales bacterium]|nr:signal peptidase II [Clostridiales bacterium]
MELFLVLFIVATDRITKYITIRFLKPLRSITVIKSVLNLTYVENHGAAFGILQNKRWFLIIIPIFIILAVTIYLLLHRKESLLTRISLAIIIGGAIGNLIDRVSLGYVVDMFQFMFINFPVFNFADIAVVCGTIMLALQLLFLEGMHKKGDDNIQGGITKENVSD